MAFADDQVITVNTVASTLPKVDGGNRSGTFENLTDGLRLRIFHLLGKRFRRVVRLDKTKVAADPLLDGVSRPYSMSVYTTIDQPVVGFSTTEVDHQLKAHADWLAVADNRTRLINGES